LAAKVSASLVSSAPSDSGRCSTPASHASMAPQQTTDREAESSTRRLPASRWSAVRVTIKKNSHERSQPE